MYNKSHLKSKTKNEKKKAKNTGQITRFHIKNKQTNNTKKEETPKETHISHIKNQDLVRWKIWHFTSSN